MSTLFDRLCFGAEQCYNLALSSAPWVAAAASAIPFSTIVAKGQTALYERPLLLRELSIVKSSLDHFRRTVGRIQLMQKESGFVFCTLDMGEALIVEFDKLLEWYNVDDLVTKVSTLSDPGWYRLQLNYMVTLMNNVLAQIQTESQTILLEAMQARAMPEGAQRDAALKKLQEKTCKLNKAAKAA